MKISIVGWYGKNNVGDEAFRCVLPKFFEGHELEFVTPPQKCNDPDIVILGGGAVTAPFYLNVLPDCPRYGLGLSIAYESEIDLLAKYNFKAVYVRNTTDVEEMRRKLGCPVESMPDLAFLLEPTGEDVLSRYRNSQYRKTVGIMATDYINPAIDRPVKDFGVKAWNFTQVMANELDKLSRLYEIVLIPCSTGGYGDDRRINLDLAAFMKTRPTNIMDTLDPVEMIDLISGLDATVCMRFHGHVFSIIAGVPFVSIGLTRKVKLLLKENGIEETEAGKFVEDEFVVEDLCEKIEAVSANANTARYVELSARNSSQLSDLIQKVHQEWLPQGP